MLVNKNEFKVEIINQEECKDFFRIWGIAAGICYNTPEEYAERVGKSCLKTQHFSGSRGNYIKFRITGVPRALVDQMVRHEVGVYKNVQSMRYTDSSNLGLYTPEDVNENGLTEVWEEVDLAIRQAYDKTVETLLAKGYTNEQARECARGLMPMNTQSSLVIGFTFEALINFMHKRLCTCSQEHIRHLALLMKKEVIKIIPELSSRLVPPCLDLMYCPESPKRSCNIRPQKEVVEKLILDYMKNLKKD